MYFAKEILRSAGQSCEWKIRENFFYLGAAAGAFLVTIVLLIFKNKGGMAFALLFASGYIFYWLLGKAKSYFRELVRFRDCYLLKQDKVFNSQEVQELVSIFRTHIYANTPNFYNKG